MSASFKFPYKSDLHLLYFPIRSILSFASDHLFILSHGKLSWRSNDMTSSSRKPETIVTFLGEKNDPFLVLTRDFSTHGTPVLYLATAASTQCLGFIQHIHSLKNHHILAYLTPNHFTSLHLTFYPPSTSSPTPSLVVVVFLHSHQLVLAYRPEIVLSSCLLPSSLFRFQTSAFHSIFISICASDHPLL